MQRESAVSEIIGATLLIGILVGAFGIFAALYLPTLTPQTIPQVRVSMACNESIGLSDAEYPCTLGTFNCHPYPFDNKTCENDCKWRDYSINPDISSEQIDWEISRCLENCLNSMCSDLNKCGVIYICHKGGDSLKITDMNVFVNSNPVPKSDWAIKQQYSDDEFNSSFTDNTTFRNGDTLRIAKSWSKPVDTILLSYSLPSGGEYTLAMNQFGTDIQ